MKQNSGRMTELETENKSLHLSKNELNDKINELTKSSEVCKAAAEKEISEKCAKFGIELINKIHAMNTVIKGLLIGYTQNPILDFFVKLFLFLTFVLRPDKSEPDSARGS